MSEKNLVSAQLTQTIWHDIGTVDRLEEAKQSVMKYKK